MNAASISFLLFALVAATAYNLAGSSAWRQFAFLAVNIYFLSTFSHDPVRFVPLAAFVAVGFIGVRLLQGGRRRWFASLLTLEIVMFIWLKKYSFLPQDSFLQFSYVTLGMSYIFFRMLHLLIEARDTSLARITLRSYLNYTLSFLTLVSGPIQRYADFAATSLAGERPQLNIVEIGRAVERTAVGIFKVSLLSLIFLNVHERGMDQLASASGFLERAWAGMQLAVAYPIFLYMNFSGYMDIVIGIGRFFGFTLPENFDRPFSAPNFMIFWNRWHMTLSNFFKTYVFNPLLLSLMRRFSQRTEPFLAVFAFFFTFFLLGIWHGQTSVFAVYGLVLGLGVSVNKLYQLLLIRRIGPKHYKTLSTNSFYAAVCRGLTFTYFSFSLFFFWSSWSQMGELLSHVDAVSLAAIWLGLLLLATAVLGLSGALAEWAASWKLGGQPVLASRYVRTALTTAAIVVTVSVIALLDAPSPENVYRAF